MTRVLGRLLRAEQPRFGSTILQLEQAAGKPSADVRLTSEIIQRAKNKIQSLGLDPNDTTSKELYHALLQRFHTDEELARNALNLTADSLTQQVVEAVIKFINDTGSTQKSFALKNSVAKRLLKKVPPKRAMKRLGYRSLESMLKHEVPAHLFAAAFLCESLAWRKKFLEQYAHLQPSDFELRKASITLPKSKRWINFISDAPTLQQHSVLLFKELGTIVVLSNEKKQPDAAITTLTLLVSGLNDISSATSFLKLQQVKPDFGTLVRTIAEREPLTSAKLVDRPVPWRVVHQYYARFADAYNSMIFEPHVQSTDLQWYHPESLLKKLHPALDFWNDTRYSAYSHNDESVSLNIFDVAESYRNNTPYIRRPLLALQKSLWQELMIRYLNHTNIEQAIASDLAVQPAFADVEEFN